MIPFVRTKDGLSFVLDGSPFHVAESDPHFTDVYDAIKDDMPAYVVHDILDRVKKQLDKLKDLSPNLYFDGAAILFKGSVLHNYAADRLLEFIAADEPVDPIVNFLEKLMNNPSSHVVEHLYAFLEHGRIPLTQDGDFLVYKAVRKDFRDIHSGRFDNHVGNTLEMARNKVDDRRDVTCSYGFHVCSYDYLPSFSHADGHVIVCKVSPADVVAVPNDYDNTKMRVCKYEVIGTVDDYYKRGENILSQAKYYSVGDTFDDTYDAGDADRFYDEDEEENYAVLVRNVGDSESQVVAVFTTYQEAHDDARRRFADYDNGVVAAAVEDTEADKVLYTWGLWTR